MLNVVVVFWFQLLFGLLGVGTVFMVVTRFIRSWGAGLR